MEKLIYYIFCLVTWIVNIGIIIGFIGIPIWFYIAGDNKSAIASAVYIWGFIILLIVSTYATYLCNKYEKKEDDNEYNNYKIRT